MLVNVYQALIERLTIDQYKKRCIITVTVRVELFALVPVVKNKNFCLGSYPYALRFRFDGDLKS